MTRCSLNEVETLLTKAARGCGADAAQAARFGRGAVMCLCTDGVTASIHAALAALPDGVIVEYAAKIQHGLAQATEQNAVFRGNDPLWAGYLAALPYRTVWAVGIECTVHLDGFEKTPKPARLMVDPEDITRWQALAAKTFVPESEQSRLAGAGAGLTDND
jgi:hypothetical protein|tara:strand:+ start:1359 stop:1841 length:483 start_codon:yes stop_codon:yes gene_type:complete